LVIDPSVLTESYTNVGSVWRPTFETLYDNLKTIIGRYVILFN